MEEIWKDVVGYEGYYQVSNLGNVRSIDRYVKGNGLTAEKQLKKGKMLKQFLKQGAWSVTLRKEGTYKFRYTYRLVAEAFIPNPNNLPLINHIDEDRTNPRVDNLEWCDYSYNITYNEASKRAGKSRNKKVIQYDKEMNEIARYDSVGDAAKAVGAHQQNISQSCSGKQGPCRGFIWKYAN